MKKFLLLIAVLWSLALVSVKAETGPVLVINGEEVVKSVTVISFEGDNVVLHFADASTLTADMGGVVISFIDATAVQSLTAYELRSVVNGRLILSGLPKGTEVVVYDAAGKQMLSSSASDLNVSHLKSGVYILKAGQQIVKFSKH
jgi:hypothetical protein